MASLRLCRLLLAAGPHPSDEDLSLGTPESRQLEGSGLVTNSTDLIVDGDGFDKPGFRADLQIWSRSICSYSLRSMPSRICFGVLPSLVIL